MITVSQSAASKIKEILLLEHGGDESYLVRVGVKAGGCSGLTYTFTFDKVTNDNDEVFEDKGIKIIVEKKSLLYLFGCEITYSGGLNGKGFEFNNPLANRNCSCGESFSI